MTLRKNFGSDNVTPMAPQILAALAAASHGPVHSYGDDEYTRQLGEQLNRLFEREVMAYPVTTGTAANALALACVTPPFGAVLCHETAHIVTDECGAPEFYTAGAKLLGIAGAGGKITASDITERVAFAASMGVHHVVPSAVSLTQASEWGTVYGLDELRTIAAAAHAAGLPVHMDGARFANAVVHLNASPADCTWRSGVDILSFGATKNGAMAAEVVVFFDLGLAREFESRRKRAGHLWSKMRYLSAQLVAYLEGDLWLAHARHANALALTLSRELARIPGARLAAPTQANEVFISLPLPVIEGLERDGFEFYRWPAPAGHDGLVIRLVTSFDMSDEDVQGLLAAARLHAEGP